MNEESEFREKFNDRYWRLNNLYWILDDHGERIKFQFNPSQEKLYWALWWLNLIPKSRQHGITTFFSIFDLDACLFNENVRAGIISHRFETSKKIFRDKIEYPYLNLPKGIRKAIPRINDSNDTLMLGNNSNLYVDTSVRGDTLQYLHISEYAYICVHAPDKAREIKRASLPTIHEGGIVAIESSPEGVGNNFHAMCEVAYSLKKSGVELTRLDFKLHFFGWYLKPENRLKGASWDGTLADYFNSLEQILNIKIDDEQRAWYCKQKILHGSDIYKEHPSTYEECFISSIEGSYFASEMSVAREKERIGYIPYDPMAKVFTFWDTGNIYTSIWFFQFKGERINAIDHYFDDLGQGVPHYAKVLQEKGYVYGEHYAGPDIHPKKGSNRKSFHTGETTLEIAARLGIRFKIIEAHSFNDRIRATKQIIPRVWFDEKNCAAGIKGLIGFRRRKNTSISEPDRPVFFEEPLRDTIDIHVADSFGHMAIWAATKFIRGTPLGIEQNQKPVYNKSNERARHVCLSGFRNAGRKIG